MLTISGFEIVMVSQCFKVECGAFFW